MFTPEDKSFLIAGLAKYREHLRELLAKAPDLGLPRKTEHVAAIEEKIRRCEYLASQLEPRGDLAVAKQTDPESGDLHSLDEVVEEALSYAQMAGADTFGDDEEWTQQDALEEIQRVLEDDDGEDPRETLLLILALAYSGIREGKQPK